MKKAKPSKLLRERMHAEVQRALEQRRRRDPGAPEPIAVPREALEELLDKRARKRRH